MIEKVLQNAADAKDFINAAKLFRKDTPLTSQEAAQLAELYQKYGENIDSQDTAKLCVAIDVLAGRSREDAKDFAGLGLSEADMDGLFLAFELVPGTKGLNRASADAVVRAVKGGQLTRPLDIIIARAALEVISRSWDFGGLREQAAELAEFLSSLGEAELDRWMELTKEAAWRCAR